MAADLNTICFCKSWHQFRSTICDKTPLYNRMNCHLDGVQTSSHKLPYCLSFLFFNFIFSSCLLTFMVLYSYQADRELQPWIAKNDDQGQKMWRINQRIVKLIVELIRNHDSPESLVIVASASDLLLRATNGMLVDGEACTLPQLEVLSLIIVSYR